MFGFLFENLKISSWITYMDNHCKLLCYIYLLALFGEAECQLDPCNTYHELNDTTMTLAFTLGPGDMPICDIVTPDWYRFVGSTEGLLSTDCPSGSECGTNQQVWMQGPIPSYYNGTTDVDICIRGNGNCCDRQSRIQVKNCNSFIVYYLIRVPPCSRYCFNETSEMLVTVSTTVTTTTTTISSTKSVLVSSEQLNSGELAGIVVGSLVSVVMLAGVAFLIYFCKFRMAQRVNQELTQNRSKSD